MSPEWIDPPTRLGATIAALEQILRTRPGMRALPDPLPDLLAPLGVTPPAGMAWRNLVVTGPGVRRAHLEDFHLPGRLRVLHLCVFPDLDRADPILGFDVICGPARATGAFLDASPTLVPVPWTLPALVGDVRPETFGEPRSLPAWGTIFSDDVVAVRPDEAVGLAGVLALGVRALSLALDRLATPAPPCDPHRVAAAHARYCDGQRRNPHTRRMVAGLLGAAAADAVVDRLLFPAPSAPPARSVPAPAGAESVPA